MAQAINTQHWPLAQVRAEVGLASWLLVAVFCPRVPHQSGPVLRKRKGWEVERCSPETLEGSLKEWGPRKRMTLGREGTLGAGQCKQVPTLGQFLNHLSIVLVTFLLLS